MHEAKKDNTWHFGMKAKIGIDARTGITHSVITTAANERDLNQAANLWHGEESFIFADVVVAELRKELSFNISMPAGIYSGATASKIRVLKKQPIIYKTEHLKASVRAKVNIRSGSSSVSLV